MWFKIDSVKAEQTYQHTAILIMLKAIEEIYGDDVRVRIGNSLNQGFYVYLGHTDRDMTTSEVTRISREMSDLIREDLPINKEIVTNAEAAQIWADLGYKDKAKLFSQADPGGKVELCSLQGYTEYFYGDVLPSTGYVELFELKPYRTGFLLRLPGMLHPESLAPYRDDIKLYTAYANTKKLRKLNDLDYLADLNRIIDDGEIQSLIEDSEASQEAEIQAIADKIVEEGRRLVLIAGPSSSGKTTFAHKLCDAIAERTTPPLYLGTDDYFVEREETPVGPDGEPDYEGLEALDMGLFSRQMEDLLSGKAIDAPSYDFVEGRKRFGVRSVQATENQMIVIEGIHSLNDALTPNIPAGDKFKLYISPLTKIGIDVHNRLSTTDARMLRRMVRDNRSRGTDAAGTIKLWGKVRAGEAANIFPYSSMADYVFNSSLVYETPMMKGLAEPLLEAIGSDDEAYPEAQRLIEFLRYFKVIEDTSSVPEGALIREFVGPKE